jgi:hypothetical protein
MFNNELKDCAHICHPIPPCKQLPAMNGLFSSKFVYARKEKEKLRRQ